MRVLLPFAAGLVCLAAGCSGSDDDDLLLDGGGTGGALNGGGGSSAGGGSSGNGGSSTGNAGTAGTGASGSPGAGGSNGGSGGGSAGASGSAGEGGTSSDSPSTSALSEILSEEQFGALFPNRNALYGYAALLAAADAYPAFASVGSPEQRRRELAAFLGNASHETTGGWPTAPGGPEAWGLHFTEEVGCDTGQCTQYCDANNTQYPCAPGKTYHGRGPIQLSWNYNYGALGDVLDLPLLADPELVTTDGTVAFTTALWFWMTAQAPKPSAHDVMLGLWQPSEADVAAGRVPGFGMTVNIINGGLECNMPTDDRVRDRIRFYTHFAELLGTTPGENLECDTMQSY